MVGLGFSILVAVLLLLALLPTAAMSWDAFAQKTVEISWVLLIRTFATACGTFAKALSDSSFLDALSKNPDSSSAHHNSVLPRISWRVNPTPGNPSSLNIN